MSGITYRWSYFCKPTENFSIYETIAMLLWNCKKKKKKINLMWKQHVYKRWRNILSLFLGKFCQRSKSPI